MVDLLNDLDPWLCGNGVTTQLASFVVIVCSIKFVRRRAVVTFGEMYCGNLEVILCLA